jgi:para-nitrobenzyl esterase
MRMISALIVCGASAILWTARVETQGASCFTTTTLGGVQGVDRGASCAFLSIPFAAPPTGSLRWKSPQPPIAWAPATLNFTAPPPNCAQLSTATGQPTGSEDCLKLNIWTPNPLPSNAPVIVFIHSGSFANASANFSPQNGQNLAARTGAIVVAPNYRLGPFGYLGHAALAGESEGAGNYGFLDQRAALDWVRAHIAAFGGDASNVTIGGQSAGGHSVSLHLVSPGSAGLFHRAIMQSGFASFRWRTGAEAVTQGEAFAAALGCVGDDSLVLPCLRSKTRDQVLLANPPPLAEQILETGRTQWTPVVDGQVIPDQPRHLYDQGAFSRVPVILGVTRDEGWNFVSRSFPSGMTDAQYDTVVSTEFGSDAAAVSSAYPVNAFPSPKDVLAKLAGDVDYVCEARRIARLIERTRTPVFLYSFEYEVDPVVPDRVVHGFDVNFVFANNFGPPLFASYTLGTADLSLAYAVGDYWTRFAATGTPNVDDAAVVHWPQFTHPSGRGNGADKYIVFGQSIGEGLRVGGDRCEMLQPFFFRSVTGAVPAAAVP